MNDVLELFRQQKAVKTVLEDIKKDEFHYYLSGLTENHQYLMTYATYIQSGCFVVYVASNVYKANLAYEAFCKIAGYENVNLYLTDEIISTELIAISGQFKKERLSTIKSIIQNKPKIIVTHVLGCLKPNVERSEFASYIKKIQKSDLIDVDCFIKDLVCMGYKKAAITLSEGEFSVRGEVIDVYGICQENPIRINLFDNEIEKIRYFDKETQRSINEISSIEIFPFNEVVYDDKEINELSSILTKMGNIKVFERDLEDLKNYQNVERINKYLYLLKGKVDSILDYLDDKVIIYDDISRLNKAYEQIENDLMHYLEDSDIPSKSGLLFNIDYYSLFVYFYKQMFCSEFKQSLKDIKLDKIYEIKGFSVVSYDSDLRRLVSELKDDYAKTYVLCIKDEKKKIVLEVLKEFNVSFIECKRIDQIKENQVNIIDISNAISFGFYNDIEVITEKELFPKIKKKFAKYRSDDESAKYESKDDLVVGDYVVHYDYGIGKYLGIETIELNKTKNDYLVIQYENMPLYVPVEKFNMLEKYRASEGVTPKLTRIGNKEWEKKKAKIKEKVDSIAKDLIDLQVEREAQKGFVYQKDNEFQALFEEGFEFEETKDQKKIIEIVKKEMEEGLVVDRLICGDVGFGKTEIAMRAAFKAVYSGKQVAYLAPTTILTRQHYYTFKERFEKFGIKVELLNRLVSEKEQRRVIEELKNGSVDVVIGTHRLLSSDVVFKDLGLLIIDEEQRFGVVHKEAIKKLKTNINVLTLSATPIPRTLQMAVMGVRQLSLIETPPLDRHPIQTYVLEYNDAIIKEAIYRELGRGGQVFYLHNRISDIELVYRKIRRLVPEARVCIGHGQMNKDDLEDTVQSFIDREYDVLLCTTIIETGIDIPNSNTLIIDDADKLGLAQLYQIRGRVGRSDKIAYAYLTYKANKVLTETEAKRLNAIKEYTTLGSGYKIAMRDLAIRGAGDILGKEQSGYIDSIGLDMYMKLLDDAIKERKGVKKAEEVNYSVDISKHVSKDYVSDDAIRIEIHKEISRIESLENKNELILEFTDRFGKLSREILMYIEEKYMESLFKKYQISNIFENKNVVTVIIPSDTLKRYKPQDIFMQSAKVSKNFEFEYKNNQLIVRYKKDMDNKEWIYKFTALLGGVAKNV